MKSLNYQNFAALLVMGMALGTLSMTQAVAQASTAKCVALYGIDESEQPVAVQWKEQAGGLLASTIDSQTQLSFQYYAAAQTAEIDVYLNGQSGSGVRTLGVLRSNVDQQKKRGVSLTVDLSTRDIVLLNVGPDQKARRLGYVTVACENE